MPGPEAGSVDNTRDVLRRTTNRAGAQAQTDHIATADDRMVQRRVDSWVTWHRRACPERDKPLAVRIDPAGFRSAVSRRASGLQRALDAGPLGGLHDSSLDVGARLVDGQPDRISHNANLGAMHQLSAVVAGIYRWMGNRVFLRIACFRFMPEVRWTNAGVNRSRFGIGMIGDRSGVFGPSGAHCRRAEQYKMCNEQARQ